MLILYLKPKNLAMVSRRTLFSFLLLFSFLMLHGQSLGPDLTLPLPVGNKGIKPLLNQIDSRLQAELSKRLNSDAKWRNLIAQKKMAVGVVDLNNPSQARFARINGNVMMYAASLPKIAILLAAMDALEKGELENTPEVRQDMRIMISRSDNQASTRMIDRLGYKKIESVLTDDQYNLYDEQYGGGLWVGKRYANQGARYPDPILGLSHAATVSQVCRFYYLLAYGQLVSGERSRQMLDIMVDPELHHKFINVLEKAAPDAKFFRKSGSWQSYHSDSVLVWGPDGRKYILVALIDDPDGEQIIRDLVAPVEEVLRIPATLPIASSER
jgi:beta-lactamase class A